jgi:hypothetical protein
LYPASFLVGLGRASYAILVVSKRGHGKGTTTMLLIRTGMRVRVTHLTDIIGVDAHAAATMSEREQDLLHKAIIHERRRGTFTPTWPKQILTPAGTMLEGLVTNDDGGFFDLCLGSGEAIEFYDGDDTIQIEVLAG